MRHEKRLELIREHLRDPIPATWAEPFHEEWLAAEGEDERVRHARAVAAELAAADPVIKPGELVIGNNSLRPIVSGFQSAFAHGLQCDSERLAALREERPEAAELLDEIQAYWPAWLAETGYQAPMSMHATLAYELFLEHGVEGMRGRVEHWRGINVPNMPESGPWYDALLITLNGVSAFIQRHADVARQAAADESGQRRQELLEIAGICEHVSEHAPRSFHEAVQLFYLIFWLCGHDSPGPMDRYLYPCLKHDLDRGAISIERAQELIDCLWLKFEEKTAYGVTIGGQLEDGSDACNELTHLCLDAIRRLRLLSPRTAFRWHEDVSPEAFAHACEVIAGGASFPALINDHALIAGLCDRGVALEHARNYSFVGCGQTYPHARGHGSYEDIIVNSAKPLELTLNNGVDPVTKNRIGLETGDAADLDTYEAFHEAYRAQMAHHLTEQIENVNQHRARHRDRWHNCLRSLVTYSCVERGLDWHAGGADYSEGMVDMVGFTTVTDSLLVIRQAVYEDKVITLPDLRDLLSNNWEGAEDLRERLLRRVPKFGNDDPTADAVMVEELDWINRHVRSHKTVFGGPWGIDIIGWSGAAELGKTTGATPDGRHKGESLADCAGPAQGRNVNGLTATLRSMVKLPHGEIHGPLVLSLRFPKQAVAGPEGRAAMMSMVETYFRGGGQDLQISIASTDEMKAAQCDPESHRDLVVRVGGFSAYFIHLDKMFQDDMIARSEAGL